MPMVRRGEIAFALSSVPRSAADPDLFHETLHVDDAVVVARVGHPLARRRALTGEDLQRYPWVLARRWELERKALDELFAESGLPPGRTGGRDDVRRADEDPAVAGRLPDLRAARDGPLGGARRVAAAAGGRALHLGAACRHHHRREETLAEPVRLLVAALRRRRPRCRLRRRGPVPRARCARATMGHALHDRYAARPADLHAEAGRTEGRRRHRRADPRAGRIREAHPPARRSRRRSSAASVRAEAGRRGFRRRIRPARSSPSRSSSPTSRPSWRSRGSISRTCTCSPRTAGAASARRC